MSEYIRAAAVFALCFVSTGCFSCGERWGSGQCRSDDDCAGGDICLGVLFGTVCATPCTCDSECEGERLCTVPMFSGSRDVRVCSSGCRIDLECEPGEICELGLCREGCRSHDECPPGQACGPADECREACREDADCLEGEICEAGCRAGCRADGECSEGERCVQDGRGFGECAPGCADDEECAAPARCLCGRCAERCASDDECPDDRHCPVTTDACAAAACARSTDVTCGDEACPRVVGSPGASEMWACCIPGDQPRCGFRPELSFGTDHCGDLLANTASDCACAEGECCLEDGGCGIVFAGLYQASGLAVCIPPIAAADPLCEPSTP